MDQKGLRDLEALCIQEESPWCAAACPLHVDARAFLAEAAKGRWEAARRVLDRTMPFPDLLGRVCDQPCRQACLRGRAGDPIAVGEVERACVDAAGVQAKPLVMPKKSGRALVAGAGLAGMTCAWDLARKGYAVTLLSPENRLGGSLAAWEPALPGVAFDRSRELLERVGADLGLGADPGAFEDKAKDFDTIFLDLDDPWAREMAGGGRTDPATLALADGRRFAGGGRGPDNAFSPVAQAEAGRKVAASMDRLMQGVSLTARREGEGARPTRLFTSLEGVEPRPRIVPADQAAGYSLDEAQAEAGRCLACECMECVKACAYLRRHKAYPKIYARQIYNNEAIVKGHHLANRMINSCSLCGQCEVLCPNDFSMASLCLGARESMVARGKMPPSAFDFALEDMRFNLGPHFSMARHAPGADTSAHAFFPGCQLAGSSPGHVEAAYAWLRRSLDGPVGLVLGCCGAPALWAGERALFTQVLDGLRDRLKGLGGPVLVTACATCFDTLAEHAPDIRLASLWQVMDKAGPPSTARGADEPLAVHDPCTSRRHPDMRRAVRSILAATGTPMEEFGLTGERTSCCGYGGLMSCADPGMAREVARVRAGESERDFLASCAMCRDMFANAGKRVCHLLDLVFPDEAGDDPAGRPAPGFSERHENRSRLKRRLLKTLWNEEGAPLEEYEKIGLVMDPEVAARLEERRILAEDVQKVVFEAEATGRRLEHCETGRYLACRRPVRVTYWVEYAPEGDGFRVFNAYSHRMVVGGGS